MNMQCILDAIARHDQRMEAARSALKGALLAATSLQNIIDALNAYLAAVKASAKTLADDVADCLNVNKPQSGDINCDGTSS
jgi:hypothetical protein